MLKYTAPCLQPFDAAKVRDFKCKHQKILLDYAVSRVTENVRIESKT